MLKFIACMFATLFIAALLAGCTTPLPEPVVINPAPTETPILPTSTPRPTSTATLTPIPTVTSTIQVELICEDPQNKLFQDPELYITSPIITSQQAKNAFADISYDEINRELADLVIEIHHAFPWETHLVLPEYVMLRDVEQFMKSRGVEQTYLKLANYVEGMEFNDKNLYLSVHAVNGRWTTSIWKRPIIFLDDKGQHELEGYLMEIVEGENGINRLSTIPAQHYGTRPKIAIVDGCEPQVVRVTLDGKVAAVLSENPDFGNINSVWINNPNLGGSLSAYGEEVGDFSYNYLLKNNKQGYPDNFVQPLEIRNVRGDGITKKYKWIALAITRIDNTSEDVKIEMGFIWKDRIFSYPVIFGGVKHKTEQEDYFTALVFYPHGNINGSSGGCREGGASTVSQLMEHIKVGDVILVSLPIEPEDEPKENFEHWDFWFYPQRDMIKDLLPGMIELVQFAENKDGDPPDPSSTKLYVTITHLPSKTSCR
jgi:hypothetical protein